MSDSYHLSLSLGRDLWEEFLRAALPVTLSEGDLDLAQALETAAGQIAVRERLAGLLDDRRSPRLLRRVRERASQAFGAQRRRLEERLRPRQRLQALGHLEARWRVELDDLGTHLTYGPQAVRADAFVLGTLEGRLVLGRERTSVPFTLRKRVGASIELGRIGFDPEADAISGALTDVGVHLGDTWALQLLSRLAEHALGRSLEGVSPLPILRRTQVEEMVAPMGGALGATMGVEAVRLDIDDRDMTLRVRLGFGRRQLEDRTGR